MKIFRWWIFKEYLGSLLGGSCMSMLQFSQILINQKPTLPTRNYLGLPLLLVISLLISIILKQMEGFVVEILEKWIDRKFFLLILVVIFLFMIMKVRRKCIFLRDWISVFCFQVSWYHSSQVILTILGDGILLFNKREIGGVYLTYIPIF